jgi:Rrf2 family protein
MRITARAEYAVRAMVELATAAETCDATLTAEEITSAQSIPRAFLLGILGELRRAGLLASVRGSAGGWRLARPATGVSLADVIRAVEGPLARVSEARPEELSYPPSAESLQRVWIALRASIRDVLERVTVDDVARGALPEHVLMLSTNVDAWRSR